MFTVAQKRSFESLASEPREQVVQCPRYRIQRLDSRAKKRTKHFSNDSPLTSPKPRFSLNSSVDHSNLDYRELESLLPKKIRKRSSVQESCPKNQAPFTFSPPSQNPFRSHCSNEKVFSWNDVRLIVSNAVSIKEQQIREEYNRILNEKLEEQFRIYFEKYNEELLAARNRNNSDDCPMYIS